MIGVYGQGSHSSQTTDITPSDSERDDLKNKAKIIIKSELRTWLTINAWNLLAVDISLGKFVIRNMRIQS